MQFRKPTQAQTTHRAATNTPTPEASDISGKLNNLLAFAGAGAGAIQNHFETKVQEDMVKQADLIANGQMVSEDATRGGRRAAAMLHTKTALAAKKVRDEEFASTNPSDEDWAAYRSNSLAEVQSGLQQFGDVQEDPEVLKLVSMQSAEDAPRLAALRESGRLKQRQAERTGALTDFLANVEKSNMTDEEFKTEYESLAKGLQLGGTAEKVLVDFAKQSGNVDTLERVMKMTDANGLSLESKYHGLRTAATDARRLKVRQDAEVIGRDQADLEEQWSKGSLSEDEVQVHVKDMNETYGGAYMTPEQYHSMRDKALSVQARKAKQSLSIQKATTGQFTDYTGVKQAEKDADANALWQQIQTDVRAANPDASEASVRTESITRMANQVGNLGGIHFKQFTDNANLAASLDVNDSSILEKNPETGAFELNQVALNKLQDWQSLPDSKKHLYGTSQSQKVLNAYQVNIQEGGMTPTSALKTAQLQASGRIPKKFNQTSEVAQSYFDVVDDATSHIFASDASEPNMQYAAAWMRMQGDSSGIDISTESGKKMISARMENETYQLSDGQIILMNQADLARSIGYGNDQDKVDGAIRSYRESNKEVIRRAAENLGLDPEDISTHVHNGQISFVSPFFQTIGTPMPLGAVKVHYDAELIKAQRAYREQEAGGLSRLSTRQALKKGLMRYNSLTGGL